MLDHRRGLTCSRLRVWHRPGTDVRPEHGSPLTPLQASANDRDVHRFLRHRAWWYCKYHHVEPVVERSHRIQDGRANQCSGYLCVIIPVMYPRTNSI